MPDFPRKTRPESQVEDANQGHSGEFPFSEVVPRQNYNTLRIMRLERVKHDNVAESTRDDIVARDRCSFCVVMLGTSARIRPGFQS